MVVDADLVELRRVALEVGLQRDDQLLDGARRSESYTRSGRSTKIAVTRRSSAIHVPWAAVSLAITDGAM